MEDPRVTAMPDCRAERPLESGEILFGYAGGDTAYALLRVKQGRIQRAYGQEWRGVDRVVDLSEGKASRVRFETSRNLAGIDRCVWTASLPTGARLKTVLATAPNSGVNVRPTPKEIRRSKALLLSAYGIRADDCIPITGGDPSEEDRRKCRKPELAATSDLDRNGRLEYWYWLPGDIGYNFIVLEAGAPGEKPAVLAEDCGHCPD